MTAALATDGLSLEMDRFSAASLGGSKELGEKSMSSVSQVSTGLYQLGLINEEGARYISMAAAGMQIFIGSYGIAAVAKTAIEARNARAEAESVAKTSAMTAIGPIGWKNIALAAGAAAVTGAVVGACVREVRLGSFDLSTAEGRGDAIASVQGVI